MQLIEALVGVIYELFKLGDIELKKFCTCVYTMRKRSMTDNNLICAILLTDHVLLDNDNEELGEENM